MLHLVSHRTWPSCEHPATKNGTALAVPFVVWRRMGDLNPRGFYPNTISNRAH